MLKKILRVCICYKRTSLQKSTYLCKRREARFDPLQRPVHLPASLMEDPAWLGLQVLDAVLDVVPEWGNSGGQLLQRPAREGRGGTDGVRRSVPIAPAGRTKVWSTWWWMFLVVFDVILINVTVVAMMHFTAVFGVPLVRLCSFVLVVLLTITRGSEKIIAIQCFQEPIGRLSLTAVVMD